MDELLARIVAQPDDDALRAVYADVLHARGDHRGELITTHRLSFRELVVLRVFADVPLAVRRAILQLALPALVVNE